MSATSDVIHHTYETLSTRRFYSNDVSRHPQDRCRPATKKSIGNNSNDISMNSSSSNLTMLPPARIQTRAQHPRGSSLPRKAKKIPSSSYNQVLLSRPKSVQDDLILNYPDPYHVTSLDHTTNDDLDSSLKTTDSGQTSGCSSGSSTVGSQSPKSQTDSDVINADADASNAGKDSTVPVRRQSAFSALPNRGPPPRHLVPATLRPSPGVKLHPTDVVINFRGTERGRRSPQPFD